MAGGLATTGDATGLGLPRRGGLPAQPPVSSPATPLCPPQPPAPPAFVSVWRGRSALLNINAAPAPPLSPRLLQHRSAPHPPQGRRSASKTRARLTHHPSFTPPLNVFLPFPSVPPPWGSLLWLGGVEPILGSIWPNIPQNGAVPGLAVPVRCQRCHRAAACRGRAAGCPPPPRSPRRPCLLCCQHRSPPHPP